MSRDRYRRKEDPQHALVEVWLGKIGGGATSADYRRVMLDLTKGEPLPEGWIATSVEWAHHRSGKVTNMVEGTVLDLASFGVVSSYSKFGIVDTREGTITQRVLKQEVVLEGNERYRADGQHGIPRGRFVSPEYVAQHPDAVYLDEKTLKRLGVREYYEDVEVEVEYALVSMEYPPE